MKNLLIACFLFAHTAYTQQVAITFDDLPFGYSYGYSDAEKIKAMDNILAILTDFDIQATMLITTGNLSENTQAILDRVKNAGHQLGNHAHRHYNFNNVSANRYIADIDSCKLIAGKWLNSNYFRYPMLRRGNTIAKRDSVYAFLKESGYVIAPVSIDNNEWIYNRDYARAKARGKQTEMDSIALAYLKHMQGISTDYHAKGKKLTGRNVKHILLLHANPINADYLDELLSWYKSNGWEFITMDEAMTDPIYTMDGDLISEFGMSQIDKLEKLNRSK